QNFAAENPCIVDRMSLNIISGTALYTLPSYVTDIRRVTWLGQKLWPVSHRDLRDTGLSGTQQSKPYNYIYNNIGQSKIQFFPVPSQSITAAITSNGLWGSEILTSVIVEF